MHSLLRAMYGATLSCYWSDYAFAVNYRPKSNIRNRIRGTKCREISPFTLCIIAYDMSGTKPGYAATRLVEEELARNWAEEHDDAARQALSAYAHAMWCAGTASCSTETSSTGEAPDIGLRPSYAVPDTEIANGAPLL
eukprot:1601614-Rhodomonas_salina.1